MTYFVNVKSYEDLKAQYRALAMENHPDQGGDLETMKAINSEYDQLFPIWKHRSANTTTETATSTRSEFYTQNGWKGENYNSKLSLKEIACIIREFIKIHYNDFKFSVTTSYASMCQELHIYLLEGPERVYKTFDELTDCENQYDCEYNKVVRKYTQEKNIGSWYKEEINNIIRPMYDKDFGESERLSLPKFLSDGVREAVEAVNDYAKSFNYSDCDGMIDYFDVNFYFFGVQIGKWDKPYKIVPRARKNVASVEYENVEVTKTRTKKVLEPREIETPSEFVPGQYFQLKASFRYGCYRGAVYQIDRFSDWGTVYSYKMGKGYKNVCKGDVRGNSFNCDANKLKEWAAKGAIAFVELVEVTKTEEYTSTVRHPKKTTAVSTEVRTDAEAEEVRATTGSKEYTITPDTDTRDGSALWVVKFAERMSREEYQETAAELKKIKGCYSKFKKGFIFRYDPAEKLAEMYSQSAPADAPQDNEQEATHRPRKSTAATTDKEKIQKQIQSLQGKIEALSGEYKTNTHKRIREQQGRDEKIRGYNFDIQILIYLYGLSEQRELTALEKCLIVGAFRDEIHSYYNRHKLWMDAESRPSAATPVKYPEVNPEYPDGWWNKDVPKKQRRLKNAGIHNTQELHAAIAEYAEIVKNATQPIDYTAQEIKQRENACKMQQKGDIQFTPESVARRLVELSGIDADSTVLEPSGGIGSIADCIREKTKNLDVVEMCADFRDLLKLKGHNLTGWDFLEYHLEKRYSHIIMNPPFSGNRDVEHVKHAFSLLQDGGALVAITSPHWTFANDKKSVEFRNWLDDMDYYTEDLSGGTFDMTGVHSKILVIHKDAQENRETA